MTRNYGLWLFAFLAAAILVGGPQAAFAASFTVDSTGDASDDNAGNGTCATAGAVCTLRAAIEEANALAGDDTINFSVTGTITLGSRLPLIGETLTIQGPGSSNLTLDLDGNDGPLLRASTDLDDQDAGFLDEIQDLAVSGLTITGAGDCGGVRIEHNFNFDLSNAVVMGNTNENNDANMSCYDPVTNSGNDDEDSSGGGLNINGSATLTNVLITMNSAVGIDGGNGCDDTDKVAGGIQISGGRTRVILSSVEITDNETSGGGGGVQISGGGKEVLFQNVMISGNTAGGSFRGDLDNSTGCSANYGPDGGGGGGGISIAGADIFLTLTNVTIDGNDATVGSGGGIGVVGQSEKRITGSGVRITDNDAGESGGGVLIKAGTLELYSSTISGNTAALDGGGIRVGMGYDDNDPALSVGNTSATSEEEQQSSTVRLVSSSVRGNEAGNDGGGIDAYDGMVLLSASSITGNTAADSGGGISQEFTCCDDGGNPWVGVVYAGASSITGNTAGTDDDCVGEIYNSGLSAIGDSAGCVETAADDIFGLVLAAADSGGCTLNPNEGSASSWLLVLSAALLFGFTRRRRIARARVKQSGLFLALIAALALAGPAQAATFDVDALTDASDANAGDGTCATAGAVCTLRAAIEEANALAGEDTITFSVTGDIVLGSALDFILETLTITGPGATSLTVDLDNNVGAVFTLGADDTFDGDDPSERQTVTITGMTITGSGGSDETSSAACSSGTSEGRAGGIWSDDHFTLVLRDAIVEGNVHDAGQRYQASGGGLNLGSAAILENVTIRDNTSAAGGGGVFINGRGTDMVTLTNVNILDNSTDGSEPWDYMCVAPSGNGGGVVIVGGKKTIVFDNVMIDGNMAKADGGGVFIDGAPKTVIFRNSTISANDAERNGGGVSIFRGTLEGQNVTVTGNSAGSNVAVSNEDTGTNTANTVASYDGRVDPFTFDYSPTPIMADSVSFDVGGFETFTDNASGVLTGSNGGTGTIDYDTGRWSLTTGSMTPDGTQNITVSYTRTYGSGGGINVWQIQTREDNLDGKSITCSSSCKAPQPGNGEGLRLRNSTITDNSADVDGGGLSVGSGIALLTNTRVTGNDAGRNGGGTATVSGLTNERNRPFIPTLSLAGTSVAGNTGGTGDNCSGEVMSVAGNSIVADSACTVTTSADVFGQLLGPLLAGDSGGCVMSPNSSGDGAPFLLLLAMALAWGISRRRRAS